MPFLENIGTPEILLIAIVVLVLFGGKKMNEWAKGLGEVGKELKDVKKEFETSFNDDLPVAQNPKTTKNNRRKGVG